MEKDNKKIGVIGIGMVGGQVFDWFSENKFDVFGYDKYKKIGTIEELEKAEIIFLCVPTPYNQETGFSIEPLEKNVEFFTTPKIFVIKSTALPGTTDYLQKKYNHHLFLFCPEFLTELTAKDDFFNPILQVVGHTAESQGVAKSILDILPKAKFGKITTAKTAELFKYTRNTFFATKVTFANQIYDICEKLKIDYEEIKELMVNDPWIGENHINVAHKGYRGFGGKCLPKDLKALIYLYKKMGLEPKLFEAVDDFNFQLLEKQNLTDKLKKDWLNNQN